MHQVMLEVMHVAELPSGWLGKTHAMSLAAQQATGEWMLFTDADVVFHPDALRRALEYATWSSADHMVLLPTVLMRSWGERMMISFLQVLSIHDRSNNQQHEVRRIALEKAPFPVHCSFPHFAKPCEG